MNDLNWLSPGAARYTGPVRRSTAYRSSRPQLRYTRQAPRIILPQYSHRQPRSPSSLSLRNTRTKLRQVSSFSS